MSPKTDGSSVDEPSRSSDPEKELPSTVERLAGFEDPDAGLSEEERTKLVRS